ncbi:MAG: efflux RND transporter periplasmic adaptor subunit, partial [Phycisphaerae bacterium]|nr:efflux RND transporter periplasmic adaptor subunit [Phycisphaerae bacterium]
TPGTIRDVLVLEGERVTKDQVLVQLYDEEQAIALRLAAAMLAEQEAKVAEMADELARKQKLVAGGAVSAAEVARLALRIEAMNASVNAAKAERDMKALILERTQVRAPRDGVVMARLASPGMAAGAMQDAQSLIELYDPASLQVRVDIPLTDAGLIAIGQPAEVQADVLPNRVFRGTVVRIVHQADIAKNTVQAKVLLLEPAPELKPEMLARVRIFARQAAGRSGGGPADGTGTNSAPGGTSDANDSPGTRQRVWASQAGLRRTGSQATAFVVTDLRDGVGIAQARTVALTGSEIDGWLEVREGLRAGDLLITTDSPTVQPGERVRVPDLAPARSSVTSNSMPKEASHANH